MNNQDALGDERCPNFPCAKHKGHDGPCSSYDSRLRAEEGQQKEQPLCVHCDKSWAEHYSLGSKKVCYNTDPNKMAILQGTYFTAPPESTSSPQQEENWVKCTDCRTTWDTKRRPYNECPVCGRPTSSPLGRQDPRNGFLVEITMHTDDARQKLASPEDVRHRVGFALEANSELEEEIDFTIVVTRSVNPTPVSVGGEDKK